jgi:hypothetical protein
MVWNMTNGTCNQRQAVARSTGFIVFIHWLPGVPLRFTPGFMLPPAPQAEWMDGSIARMSETNS